MVVVSNTTPLNYLVLAGAIDVLPLLFGEVLIPEAVRDELGASAAPSVVREWIEQAPTWLHVRCPSHRNAGPEALDAGEAEAIALASEVCADLLLLDESAARREATRRSLPIAGTLAILDRAADRGLLDFQSSLERLRSTNFHLSDALIQHFLERDATRRRPPSSEGEET
jgi:predicted nucleic acid-binding protein